MGDFTGLAKMKDMELMARGNPRKLAELQSAKRAYETLTRELFDEVRPFADNPAPSYVEQLKAEAEAEDADEQAKARYAIMKERADYYKYQKREAHFDEIKTRNGLRQKLAEGNVTQADVLTAEKYVRKFPSPQNLAMYARMKRITEQGADKK